MESKREIFILFDKKDRDLLREMKQHLTPLERQGLVSIWDEEQTIAGTDRDKVIEQHLQDASLILLLLSSHFMASPELYDYAKRALAAQPEKHVIPVLLHEVDWEHSEFGRLVPLPSNRKPVSIWANRSAALHNVAKGIRSVIEMYPPLEQLQDAQSSSSVQRKQFSETPLSMDKIEPSSSVQVTITAPDGSRYIADVPDDTFIDRLLNDFLYQWPRPQMERKRSVHFSLRAEGGDSSSLDRSSTLREVGLATQGNLMLISEPLTSNEPINLMIEDKQGERYTATVTLNTVVDQLADAFLREKPGEGKVIVDWVISATETARLRLEASLYDQGICDNALLRIYRIAAGVEE